MKFKSFIPMLNLQLFAEGAGAGDGGTAQGQGATEAAALPQTKGAKSNPLADVKYGIQEETAPAAEVQETTTAVVDRNAEFEKLIKGEYKDGVLSISADKFSTYALVYADVPAPNPNVPNTGDQSQLMLFTTMLLLAAAGLYLTSRKLRRA